MLQFLSGVIIGWILLCIAAGITYEKKIEKVFTHDWKLITEGYYFCKCDKVEEGQEHNCVCTKEDQNEK